MGAATREENAPNRGFTLAARQACAQVDAMFELKKAPYPVGIHVIGDRRATEKDGMIQYLAQGLPEALKFGPGEAARVAARADAGVKEAFIGVDVAHS
jgi:hypothetical protein